MIRIKFIGNRRTIGCIILAVLEPRAEALEFSGKPGHASLEDAQGFSCMCGLGEPYTASVKMKQNSSWRVLLGQILLLTSLALALAIVHWLHAADGAFHLAADSREIQFGGHG